MKPITKLTFLAVAVSVLTGCASNDEISEQQKQQVAQINILESKVNVLEHELQRQKNTDKQISRTISQLDMNQRNLTDQVKQTVTFYAIKQNDTLSKVAEEYGMYWSELIHMNPQIKNPHKLLIGQIIIVK
jgi:N-acetylmuramoyl-L-alanine amidase